MPDRRNTERAPFHPWGNRPFADGEADSHVFDAEDFDDAEDLDENEALVHVPTPGWNQHPEEFNEHPHFDPTSNWGNAQLFVVAPLPAGGTTTMPQAQILDATLQMPAVCTLRLSAQALDGVPLTPANDFITWEVLIGVGNATQTRFYKQAFSPTDGSVDTDIFLATLPAQHLAIRAIASFKIDIALERRVQVAAQFAARATTRGNTR